MNSQTIHPKTDLIAHPIAAAFPMLAKAEMDELIEDIKANGLSEDIVLLDGMVIDGRNRLYACVEAEVKPHTRAYSFEFDGPSPTKFVIGKNIHRRHLSPSSRAVLATEMIPFLNSEMQDRAQNPNTRPAAPAARQEPVTTSAEDEREQPGIPEEPKKNQTTAEAAAELFGSSATMVKLAKALKEKAPDLYEKVVNGELTVNAAKKAWEVRQAEKKADVNTTKDAVERQQALDVLADTYGKDHEIVKAANKKKVLKKHAELLLFSGLPKVEGLKIIPLMVKGWTVEKAQKYLNADVTADQTLEDTINQIIAKGKDKADFTVNGWKFTVAKVTRAKKDKAADAADETPPAGE
jgi:hypothetical protein